MSQADGTSPGMAGGGGDDRAWSPADAVRVADGLLGRSASDAVPVPCSAGNQAFVLRVGEDRVVMKTAGPEAVRAEAAVLALLAGWDGPVPAVVAADPDGAVAGRPVLVTRFVAGEPLGGPAPELAEVGALLRRVHEVELDGFGPVVAAPEGLRGTMPSWSSALAQRVDRLDEVVAAGHLPRGLADRALAAVHGLAADATADGGGRGRLLHGDLHPRHVFAAGGRVTAVIDWGDATAGDPAYEMGRLLHSGVVGADLARGRAQLDALAEGYGPLPGPWERIVGGAVAFVTWAMAGELDGGSPWPPWWGLQVAALTELLDELEGGGGVRQ